MSTGAEPGHSSGTRDSSKERDHAHQAELEYDNGNYGQCLEILNQLRDTKAVDNNKTVAEFGVTNDVDALLNRLTTGEELDLDQQVLIDYNRSLALAKYKQRYDEAIDILEARMSILSEPFGCVDERLTVKLCLLLAIIHIEKKKNPSKALPVLQFISEKCDQSLCPPRLQQLKAKCYLQLGSTKAAKRELKSICGEPLLRTYLELQRNNLKKAMKIFNTCSEESPMYINNEALIQYSLGKRNTSVQLLSKIVDKCSPEMLYNLAIMHLFTGNTRSAFDILYNLVPHFKMNPRLWLRLAECCLEERNRSGVNDFDLIRHKTDLVDGTVGEGLHRKLVLRGASCEAKETETLTFVRGCLLNSLCLLNSDEVNFYPSNPPSETEMKKLQISVFLDLAYVNILLHDYIEAYRYTANALKLNPVGHQKILAHLYAGEALIWLDEVTEAIGHFSPTIVDAAEATANREPENGNPSQAYVPWYPHTAKIVMLYNLAVAHTLRGEFSKANDTLRSVPANISNASDVTVPVQVIMLAIYLQLQQGFIETAKSMIRQHLPQYR